MNHVLRKGASLARLGIPGMALVCLVQGCARKDRAAGHSPIDTTNPASTAATTTTSGAPMDTSLRPLDELTDADKSSAPRRVRLLGLTEPAKDMPQLRVRGARVELGGAFDEHLWEHHDRLVVLSGVLSWTPLRAVSGKDEDGNAIQTRSHVGGWRMSEITEVRPPGLADLVGRNTWVEGTAKDGPSVGTAQAVVKVERRGAWQASWRDRRVRVEGRLESREGQFILHETASLPLEPSLLADSDIELAGRCWSMNGQWWFDWRGERMEVEAAEGIWPPRHLPGGGHGELARVKGRILQWDTGASRKVVLRAAAVRAIGVDDAYSASW